MFRQSLWNRLAVAAAALFAFVVLVSVAWTQTESAKGSRQGGPPVTMLYPAGTLEFSATPPLMLAAGMQCDLNANIYLQIAPSYQVLSQLIRERQPLNLSLTKLSTDSQGVTRFPATSPQGYSDFSSKTFYVTPRGKVLNLGRGCKEGSDCKKPESWAWLVTAYNEDGTVDDMVELHPRIPANTFLFLSGFAAFPDGRLMATGEMQTKDGGLRPLTAIFGPAGNFLATVELPRDVEAPQFVAKERDAGAGVQRSAPSASGKSNEAQAFTQINRAVVEGRMVGSPDGTVYLLRAGTPERLYAVGSDGRVEQEKDINMPKSGLTPLDVSVNGEDQLVIYYAHSATGLDPSQDSALALVDPHKGRIVSIFDVPPKAGVPACMTNQNVIQFVRESKSGHLEVAEYAPQ